MNNDGIAALYLFLDFWSLGYPFGSYIERT